MKFDYNKFERSIGSMKFAVISISLFTLFMIIGTFLESYYGTDYANRVIYKKWPFIIIQGAMLLSILFAAFQRLPPKKRLYGFYTIHAGLIMIGCGAAVTYIAGIDGNILLHPSEPTRNILLADDILRVTYPNEGKQFSTDLPYTAFSTDLDINYDDLNFSKFHPYSQDTIQWSLGDRNFPPGQSIHSSEYLIYNDRFSQKFIMTLHPEAIDYSSSSQLGPLGVHYLPSSLGKCFSTNSASSLVIWDSQNNSCRSFESYNTKIQTIKSSKKRFFVIQQNGVPLTFFPDLGPFPMDRDFQPVRNSPLRVFNFSLFQDKPNLFVFGKAAAFYENDKWNYVEFNGKKVELPWMGFSLELIRHEPLKLPTKVPMYVTPIQKNGSIIKGEQKAIKVNVKGKTYWVTDTRPISLMLGTRKVIVEITKRTVKLPFEFVLRKFKMDTNPGTSTPASYESFVTLFTKEGPKEHHIFMNNPLKRAGFTFYQASYHQNQDGSYSSTLSANVDQGRPLKYFGSLLMVLGSIWHFYLKRRKVKVES